MLTIGNQNFYTTDEIAKIIDREPPHVRTLIRSGRLDSIKTGKSYLVPVESVEKYIEYRRKKGRKYE